jgi:RNA polymerase sigma-70 factor, ECF subfamily
LEQSVESAAAVRQVSSDIAEKEAELVARAKSGERMAFNQLVRLHGKRVYNTVLRILGDQAEAEDVSQEVFLKMYQNIGKFRGDAKLSTWLYRLSINNALNRVRARKRRMYHKTFSLDAAVRTEEGEVPQEHPDTNPDPRQILESRDTQRLVQEGISKLPDDQRTVIVLRDIQGLTYNEIAGILDCNEGTVKSRLHRARMALKDILKEVGLP